MGRKLKELKILSGGKVSKKAKTDTYTGPGSCGKEFTYQN